MPDYAIPLVFVLAIIAAVAASIALYRKPPETILGEFETHRDPDALHVIVRGSRHPDPEGRDRQQFYRKLSAGQKVAIQIDSWNPVDPDAVGVYALVSEETCHLGYLPADFAHRVADELRDGCTYACHIHKIMQDKFDSELLVVLLEIKEEDGD